MSNSNRIGTYSFRVLTELISETYDLSLATLRYLNGMSTSIYNTDINTRKSEVANLRTSILKTYSAIVLDHIASNVTVLNAVRSLNRHVLETYGVLYDYQNMDAFLLDQYLSVPPSYAQLSSLVGYEITVQDQLGDLNTGSILNAIQENKSRYKDIGDEYADLNKSFDLLGWENL